MTNDDNNNNWRIVQIAIVVCIILLMTSAAIRMPHPPPSLSVSARRFRDYRQLLARTEHKLQVARTAQGRDAARLWLVIMLSISDQISVGPLPGRMPLLTAENRFLMQMHDRQIAQTIAALLDIKRN